MKVENIKIEEIKPYSKNPRKNEEAIPIVKKSIAKYGFVNPIVLDKNNEIVCGHTRYKAALELGLKEVPVLWADHLSEKEIQAYRIMDNKSSEYAQWDRDVLKLELKDIDELIKEVGFTDDELDELFKEQKEVLEKEVTEPLVAKSEIGDVWLLGNQLLMCGDCNDVKNIEFLKGYATNHLGFRGEIHAVITDPPYNVALNEGSEKDLQRRKRRTNGVILENDKMGKEEFEKFLRKTFENLHKIVIEGAPIYVFYGDKSKLLFQKTFEESGFHYHQDIVWNKLSLVIGNYDYQSSHESVIYGWKLGKERKWYGDRKQKSVIDVKKPSRSSNHLSSKPLAILEQFINNSTQGGNWLFEPFAGSGSLLLACENLGRKSINFELVPIHIDRIVMNYRMNVIGGDIKLFRFGEEYSFEEVFEGED